MTISDEVTAERLVPILAVKDIYKTVDYYVNGLGFDQKGEWTKDGRLRWCMLAYPGGAAIMAQEGEPDGNPDRKGAGIRMYIWCSDAQAFYEMVTKRGIEAKEPFIGNGMHVVELKDPDGYDISFQSPA